MTGFCYPAELRLSAAAVLLWCQSQPGCQLPSIFKIMCVTDTGNQRTGSVGATPFRGQFGYRELLLLLRAVWNEKCSSNNLVLHSDNGGPMPSYTLLAKMYALGVLSVNDG